MIDKNDIYKNIHELLNKAKVPIEFQSSAIYHMMDSTRFDMQLKISVMEDGVSFYMYERGSLAYCKTLQDKISIQYIILEYIISSMYNKLAYKEHVSSDGHIDMKWTEDEINIAFEKIGEPYNAMHKEKISIFNI